MPRASELEEFGLEVESEHHALVSSSGNNNSQQRRQQPLELSSTPTKAQLSILQSTNTPRPSLLSKPSMLKWALVVLALAFIVFMNIGQEQHEDTVRFGEQESMEELEAKALEERMGDWVESGDEGGAGNVSSEYRVFGDDEKIKKKKNESTETKKKVKHESTETKKNVMNEGGGHQADTKPYVEKSHDEEDDAKDNTDEQEDAKDNTDQTETKQQQDLASSDGGKTNDSAESKDEDKQTTTTAAKATIKGEFTSQHVSATRKAAQELITMLETYYYGSETMTNMLLKSWVGAWNFDIAALDEADEMVQKIVDTMIRALVTKDQREFIIGTIGSSVAAGHDNCNYDSYENQLQRTLSPVWEAADMKFTVQNAGEGGGCGDSFANQVYCIKQNVSPKIDIAHYTWSYFEVGDQEGAWIARENLIRWTQMMPRQPPVHVINVEGGSEANDVEKEMQKYYAKYGYNAFYMRYALRQGGHDYDTEAKNGIDRFGWGYVGDGYHNTTRYGELVKDDERRDSLGVVLRNWHPGPLGFQLVSDAFAMVYSKAILLALDIIEENIAREHDLDDMWGASKRKIVLKKALPEPLHCNPEYCVVDEAPGCINYELPTYGVWGPRVEDPNDELNPHKGQVQNWEVWYEPRDFWHLVAKEEVVYFQDRDDKEICKHLDNCAGLSAESSENGMVVFRLPKMEVGLVAICGCCGKDVATPMFLENENIEVRYNGALLDRSSWDLFPNEKCARLLKRFPTEGSAAQTPTGHAYLSVKALDGLETPVRISHVITL